MLTTTTSIEINTPKSDDGYTVGQTSAALIGFYGATPITRPTSASQAAVSSVVDLTTATANWSSGIAVNTATYVSAVVNSAFATLVQNNNNLRTLVHQLRAELVSLGLIHGS